MTAFGPLIRSYRLRAGLGLRTFAGLIDERASTTSAIESGRRAPWRKPETLHRVAEVLGLVESSNLWKKILELTRKGQHAQTPAETQPAGELGWWWSAEDAPSLDDATLNELATFVGATFELQTAEHQAAPLPALTELSIEWRVRQLLGQRNVQVAAAPVDVEAVLENEANIRLEIVPGLIPRFSVQACVVKNPTGMTFFIDRIIADSRPLASYRELLALCYAPAAIRDAQRSVLWQPQQFRQLQASSRWQQLQRDCDRFALAMLLPANTVLSGAESAYTELVQQQGWIEVDDAARTVRNRLAEQFAVPPLLVHRRLVGWPCHLYGRIAQALAAQEPTLPPSDWMVEEKSPRQQTLFDVDLQVS